MSNGLLTSTAYKHCLRPVGVAGGVAGTQARARTDVRTNEELLTFGLSSYVSYRAQGGCNK